MRIDLAFGSASAAGQAEALVRLNLVGESPAWRKGLRLIGRIAACDATTLIEGETGTGKELVAGAIHYLGARRDFPFVPLNCGALPDALLEAELFGYEKGAFTGAQGRRTGLVAAAHEGTLFLDEVEAMSQRAQVVLLRFLQDQTYFPVGGRTLTTGNVRIIAASNATLDELADKGQIRRDLLFRLRVLMLRIPPLRDREGDVALLAQTFLDRCSRIYQRPPRRLSAESIAALEAYDWPGNVRQLESLIVRAFLLDEGAGEELSITGLDPGSPHEAHRAPGHGAFRDAKAQAVAEFEKLYLERLLSSARGNLSLAARLSRKDRSALRRLLQKHGLRPAEFRGPPPELASTGGRGLPVPELG